MSELNYPNIKADIDLCYRQLFEICKGERKEAIMCVPHTAKDFDMQFSAAFDELKAYREAEAEGRLVVLPCKVGDWVYVLTSDALCGYEETQITSFNVNKSNIKLRVKCVNDDWGGAWRNINILQLGKTVFLTREEAEATLKGEKQNARFL